MLSVGLVYIAFVGAAKGFAIARKDAVMITLYHAPQSRSSRMIWLLEELGQPYEIKPVSIFRPMSGEGAEDAANPHPDKRVPALTDDAGGFLAESVAILLHLTDAYPEAGFGPQVGDPQRGTYLTWLVWYAAELEPAMMTALTGGLEGSPMHRRAYETAMRRVVQAVEANPYAMGDSFTGVDFLLASAIRFARPIFPQSDVLDAYVARCMSRPAAVRAAALDEASGVQQPAELVAA